MRKQHTIHSVDLFLAWTTTSTAKYIQYAQYMGLVCFFRYVQQFNCEGSLYNPIFKTFFRMLPCLANELKENPAINALWLAMCIISYILFAMSEKLGCTYALTVVFFIVHDDVIKWKYFPRNWPFARGIHRSRWIPHRKASDAELWCLLWSASE